ncbi:helix-hairpin-helix protein [Sphingobacterium allocomposti]|uniref:Helix-hairpin-helix protein n=2 Tax=Sphingobacterium allocomposti TaxID=415956 RepID=A0A5S5CU44_9SPHI|nr:helix-hairpin-helix protein [Sphingobacterium composti Yoo et al. 2007 non Ten et al. 2007]
MITSALFSTEEALLLLRCLFRSGPPLIYLRGQARGSLYVHILSHLSGCRWLCRSAVLRTFRSLLCFLSMSLSSLALPAQVEQQEETEEALLEQLVEGNIGDLDPSDFHDRLQYYLTRPLDLNKASERDFVDFVFLTPLQISNIIKHRNISGNYLSVLELQTVEGMDLQTAEMLAPFVTVSSTAGIPVDRWRQLLKEGRHELTLRFGRVLEKQHGYHVKDKRRAHYLGDPNRYMLRYRFNYNDRLRLSFNAEKDAGEAFFRHGQKWGFDHYGISLYAKPLGVLREFVIGDFIMQTGQGLVLWNGLSFGKGAMMTTSARQGVGFRSHTAMNEHHYLRGGAARLAVGNIAFTPFVSWRRLTGNVDRGQLPPIISSISTSGLHRTPTEIRNRRSVNQFMTGLDVTYQYRRLKLGLTGVYTQFDGVLTRSDHPRYRYAFQGDRLVNIALNYQYTYRNVYLFGESAHEWNRGWATINGIIASLHPKISAFFNYRNYKRDYYAFFAQALGESSEVSNEKGFYGGMSYRLDRKLEWVTYADLFTFPWLRYRVDIPSSGADILSQLTFHWYKRGKLSVRYRYRVKQENRGGDAVQPAVVGVLRNQVRVHFQYKLSPSWEIRSRAEVVSYLKESQEDYGGLFFQDVFYRLRQGRLSVNSRIALFSTQSYDARLYAYENDIPPASSFPMYNGKGWRSYMNIHFRLSKEIALWLRYSMTHYTGVEQVGSGLDRSEGNKRSDVKLQMRLQW